VLTKETFHGILGEFSRNEDHFIVNNIENVKFVLKNHSNTEVYKYSLTIVLL
jgi:hypothetical protein